MYSIFVMHNCCDQFFRMQNSSTMNKRVYDYPSLPFGNDKQAASDVTEKVTSSNSTGSVIKSTNSSSTVMIKNPMYVRSTSPTQEVSEETLNSD